MFLPAVLTFIVGLFLTPWILKLSKKYHWWKRVSRRDNQDAMSDAFLALHNETDEVSTPRVGGIVIWGSVVIVSIIAWFVERIWFPAPGTTIDFITRSQTWVPLAALITGGFVGLAEDMFEIYGSRSSRLSHGIPSWLLVSIVAVIGFVTALWFYFKLGVFSVTIPIIGVASLGLFFIPFFVIVVLGSFSSRVIDGIDGLAGGVMAILFGAYGIIALLNNQIALATLGLVIAGGILAFLWSNVPPAKFYMGETGMLGLTLTLAVMAFLTDQVLLLPIMGAVLVATSLSSAIQISSKKYFKRKVFLVAPLHWHFHSLGWKRETIVMRYWILTLMLAFLGIVLALVG
jgi:phospho-N-acetylmuramoyl-pentapeptide-transferase